MGRIADGTPALPNARPQRGCHITKLMVADGIDDDDRETIIAKLADRELSDGTLALWFLGLGEVISVTTISNHRRGLCCAGVGKVR